MADPVPRQVWKVYSDKNQPQPHHHWGKSLLREIVFKKIITHEGASLVAQWLRIRLPMQGTRVQALVREVPTCCGAMKPVRHNY